MARKAGLVLLDYDTREEQLAMLFSDDFGDMVELLTDTVAALRKWRSWFKTEAFNVRPPVSALLQCGYTSAKGVYTGIQFTVPGWAGAGIREKVRDRSLDVIVQELKGSLPQGGFIAEFAINTSALTIYYYPPERQARARFTFSVKALTTANLSTTADNPLCGNLHFDLNDSYGDPTLRSKFIVNHCLRPGDLCASVTSALALPPAPFINEGTRLPVPVPQKPKPKTTPIVLKTPDPGTSGYGHFPTVIVEDLSSLDGAACHMLDLILVGIGGDLDAVYQTGCLNSKLYTHQLETSN